MSPARRADADRRRSRWPTRGALALLLTLAAGAALAPYLPMVADPLAQDLALGASPPALPHPLGTDELGRDLLARLLAGGRLSLTVAAVSAVLATALGAAWGALAARAGGRLERGLMHAVDVLDALPHLVLVLAATSLLSSSLGALLLALALVQWLPVARVVHRQVRALAAAGYLEAARALGAGELRLAVVHVAPQLGAPLAACAILAAASAMLHEAFLGALGLGVQPPLASWGTLLADGARHLALWPWLAAAPGLAVSLTALALHALGERLR